MTAFKTSLFMLLVPGLLLVAFPVRLMGVAGGLFFLPGTAVAAWQLTKPMPPE
jgi:hypothetical protein